MYYNDQPADMILYQGLAYLKLGKVREAKSRFYRLINYREQHLEDQVKIEYSAVFLPDFLIFDEDYTAKNRAHCYYLMALGNIGLGNKEKADGFLKEDIAIEPSHMMCRVYEDMVLTYWEGFRFTVIFAEEMEIRYELFFAGNMDGRYRGW